jgi:1-phosphatidylinositol-3-phosphate 5-kinase
MPMRSFTHKNSRVLIHIETLPQALSVSAEEQRQIFMWSRCKTCDSETPLTKMSNTSWGLSLAKYLELTFNGENYRILGEHACKTCSAGKSAHWNYYRNFCRGDKIVCFEHQAIEIPELVVPDAKVQFEPYVTTQAALMEKLDHSRKAADQLLGEIEDRLTTVLDELDALPMPEGDSQRSKAVVLDMGIRRQQDFTAITDGLDLTEGRIAERFEDGSTEVGFAAAMDLEGLIYDQRNQISSLLATWNQRMSEHASLFSSAGKPKARVTDGALTLARSSSVDASLASHGRSNSSSLATATSKGRSRTPVLDADAVSTSGASAVVSDPPMPISSARETRLARSISTSAQSGNTALPRESSSLTASRKSERFEESGVEFKPGEPKAKISFIKKLTDAIQSASNTAIEPLRNPFTDNLHYCGVRNRIGVEVRKDEPSSIIAFALASTKYTEFVTLARRSSNIRPDVSATDRSTTASPAAPSASARDDFVDNMDDVVTPPTPDFPGHTNGGGGGVHADKRHFRLHWTDRGTKFTCRVFYAKEFRALRRQLYGAESAGEQMFVKSLSRCTRWDPHGGKSKASFCKMNDDRFILKQMSGPEAQSSIEFMPEYIRYTSEAHATNKPTVLAKILGIFHIRCAVHQKSFLFTSRCSPRLAQMHIAVDPFSPSCRYKTASGAIMEQDVLIIENLFAGRELTITFDLKGSMRSRYAHRTGNHGDVLLDENLLEYICDRPLYLRKHCKWAMETAIENDSVFLSNNGVMDYSLLLGIDDEHKVVPPPRTRALTHTHPPTHPPTHSPTHTQRTHLLLPFLFLFLGLSKIPCVMLFEVRPHGSLAWCAAHLQGPCTVRL